MSDMKPVLFNIDMVKAVLEGNKTVTRRPVKTPKKLEEGWGIKSINEAYDVFKPRDDAEETAFAFLCAGDQGCEYIEPPYVEGDVLYVRETWSEYWMNEDVSDTRLMAPHYRASWDGTLADDPPWKPSIHMPARLARIFLKVTSVTVERVQEITDEEAIKEGIQSFYTDDLEDSYFAVKKNETPCGDDAASVFGMLWDSIYSERNMGMDDNQWVWRIAFEQAKDAR